jgi:hypothetical protein
MFIYIHREEKAAREAEKRGRFKICEGANKEVVLFYLGLLDQMKKYYES